MLALRNFIKSSNPLAVNGLKAMFKHNAPGIFFFFVLIL